MSKGGRVMVVGRLQQQCWAAQAWSVRSVVEVVAEEMGEPAMGDRHAGQGHEQRQQLDRVSVPVRGA